jgi:hypothetical protein
MKWFKENESFFEPKTAKFPKKFHDIDASLNHHAIRPDAPWGFVVFRTVYSMDSDAPWVRMLELLRSNVANTLPLSDRTDLLPRHELTVIEDEETLARADTHTVRHTFRAWVADNLTPRLRDPDHGGSAQIRAKLLSNDAHGLKHHMSCLPPMWNFCLFVNEACFRSLDASIGSGSPVIKILTTDWQEDRAAAATEV